MSALIKTSVLFGAALALGRLIGFLREMLLAARLGVGPEADIAVVLVTLPDFLVALLLMGGFTAALIPALKRREGAARDLLFRYCAWVSVAVGIGVALVVASLPGLVFRVLAPGLEAEATAPWHASLALVTLSIPLAALTGAIGAYLNVKGRFAIVGIGTVVYNLTLCAVLLPDRDPSDVLSALALGIVAAGLVRLGLVGFAAAPPLRPLLRPPVGADRRLLGLFAAGVAATGVTVLSGIVFRTIAGLSGAGDLAAFAFALRLFELPFGLLLAPLANVLLPRLATDSENRRLIFKALASVLAVAVATLAVGLLAGEPIARVIYFRGEMTADGLAQIVANATGMFFALPFGAAALLGATVLNARQRSGVVLFNTATALVAGTAVALAGQVMAGFILFHAISAVLNLGRAGILRAPR